MAGGSILRRGVHFHDGSPFDGTDVLATFARLGRLGGPYASFPQAISKVSLPEPHCLELFTETAQPLLPVDLSHVSIIHRQFQDADSAAFDQLAATLGTGPFRLRTRLGSRTLQFDGFDGYWGGQTGLEQLEFRLIDESGLASVSALLAGEVDLIDNVGPDQCLDLQRRDDVTLSTCDSNRVWYLFFDQSRDCLAFRDRPGWPAAGPQPPAGSAGATCDLALDRPGLHTQRLMAGQGTPVGDVAGPGCFRGQSGAGSAAI